jgi:rod shape-determining protein MreD
MTSTSWRLPVALYLTLALALVLMLLPMPEWAEAWRPHWLALVLAYWTLALPDRCGLATAWVCGLCLDTLQDRLLGHSAFVLTLLAYLVMREHRRIRMYSMLHQAILLASAMAVLPLATGWLQGLTGHAPRVYNTLPSALTTLLLWPLAFIVLRDLRRRASR